MRYFYITCWFLFLFGCSKNDQSKSIENNNKDSISTYIQLANKKDVSVNDNNLYLKKAFDIVVNQKNDSLSRAQLLEITIGFFNENNRSNFNTSSNYLLKRSIESKDTLSQAQAYRYKAAFFKNTSINDSAFYYYLKAEKLFEQIDSKTNLGSVLSYKSVVQYNVGDYVGADRSLTKAYKVLKNLGDDQKLFVVYTMMGIVANETKDFDKAIEYYSKTLDIIKKGNLTGSYQEATCLNNIGYVYQNKKDYKEAIKNYKLALTDKTIKQNEPELYGFLTDNLAYCKFKQKEYDGLPDLFNESLKIRESIKSTTYIILSKIHLSEYYASKNDLRTAEKFANEALILAKSTKIPRDILASLKQNSAVDRINASKYTKDYIRISDSIQDIERISKEKFARLELETDEISQENEALENRNRTLLYFFVVTFIIIVLLFVVRAQRTRTRELLYKQAQQKANEDIYNLLMSQQNIIDESRSKEKKRLAQDLHDGILGRMFGLRLNLDSLNSNPDIVAVQKRLELLKELKTIEQDIREISHDLNREKQVLINNFVSIVHNLLEEQKSLHEANLIHIIDNNVEWDKVGNAIKINMYRILQESLQNINKYANAKNINVEIKSDMENVYLKIKDDGLGFDINKKSKGIGMQNMISRTQECKGIIDIKSKKDKGTTITITIPIETKQIIEETV